MLRKLDGPPDTTKYMHEQQLIDHLKSILSDPNVTKPVNSEIEETNERDTRDLNGKINKEHTSLKVMEVAH